ncbi:hypothetical protein JCM10207_004178 [Rhodosporidiobolus poonsookiae]
MAQVSLANARQRLSHPHYHLNLVLSLVFPLVVLLNAPTSSTLTLALLAAPVLIALSAAARARSDNIESLHETTTFQLRLFNVFGLWFTRHLLGTGKRSVAFYLLAWLLVSFFFPQPEYLGPSKLRTLSTDEFDTQILLIPPAPSAAAAFAAVPPPSSVNASRIVELDDLPSATDKPFTLGSKEAWNVVLFHVDFSKKSRELELTLARLSWLYTSRTLSFSLLTPASAPGTFYDLDLSTSATSMDLPLVRVYKAGKVVGQLPMGEEEAKARRRADKRSERRGGGKTQQEREEESEEGSDTDSDDEREVAQMRGMSRLRWDTTAAGLEKALRLRERSGLFAGAGAGADGGAGAGAGTGAGEARA